MEPPHIISMEFSTSGRDDCYYRIRAGRNVKYVTVQAGALDAETLMDMQLDFHNILPSLPYNKDDWNQGYISRNPASGELESKLARADLPGVQTIWHPQTADFLDLERVSRLTPLAQESVWKSTAHDEYASGAPDQRSVIAKMAHFPWEIAYIQHETRIYKRLQSLNIAPRFLGHIQEAGRVIGFLLEKVEGRHADPEDLEICKEALRRLHSVGVLHGDCNRYNFIIGVDGLVTLIDFADSKVGSTVDMMEEELGKLEAQLYETDGRGGGFAAVDTDEECM